MNKFAIYISALTLVNLVALSAGFWAVNGQLQAISARIEQPTPQLRETLSRKIQTVSDELKAVGAKVEQQTALFNRALGKELLVQVPPDVEDAIKDIEDQLQTESRWPTTEATVQQLNERLAGTLETLPPWAQEELLPRLLPRRWEINALWLLANDLPKDVDDLSSYVQTVEAHVSSKPTGSAQVLADKLTARQDAAEKSLKKAERSAAIEVAKSAIKEGKDFEKALALVAAHEDDSVAKDLATQLNRILLSRAITDAMSGVRTEIKIHESLTDPALRAHAASRTQQTIMDLRLRAKSANLIDATLENELNELDKGLAADFAAANKGLQAIDAAKSMRYQVWALDQIKKVRTWGAIEAIEINKIPGDFERRNLMSEARSNATKAARKVLRNELITYMAPIDQRALDEAVSQWFRKVYQERLNALDDDAERLAVVTGFATTVKKLPE